jgi:hypothetical protein
VTAVSPLAATPDGHSAFVRLDSKALFANPAQLVQAVEAIFNRFLVGDISKAVRFGWQSEVRAALTQAAGGIWAVIQPVVDWISRKDLAIEFAEVKLEIKESGSRK